MRAAPAATAAAPTTSARAAPRFPSPPGRPPSSSPCWCAPTRRSSSMRPSPSPCLGPPMPRSGRGSARARSRMTTPRRCSPSTTWLSPRARRAARPLVPRPSPSRSASPTPLPRRPRPTTSPPMSPRSGIQPAQVSYKSASAGCDFTAPSTVTCSFGPLAPNLSVSFDITVHISVAATGTLTNTANVKGNETETNQANDTATATTVVSPQTTPGKVTGGGVINVTGGTANFGFVAQRKTTGGPASGNLNYLDHATKRHVQGPVTSLTITGNSAEFSGPCGTSCTFTVAVQDKAEPDGSGKDMFYITVNPPAYRAGGVIRSGNIQVHSESPAPAQRGTVATGAGEGIFPSGAALNGILLNGLQFGKGVDIPGDGSATGD